MKNVLLHILFILMLGINAVPSRGQNASAKATLDSASILIGSQTRLELTASLPYGSRVNWPMFADTLTGHVEILRKSALDTLSSDERQFTIRQNLLITSFDSGYYVIPPIRIGYLLRGDTTTYYTQTAPVSLSVNTIQTDQKQDIRPIKPPLKAPITFREIMTWVLLLLLIAAIAFGVYYFLKKRKKKEPLIKLRLKPTIPPDEAALEAFETLRLKKLWQSGRVKEYYSEMTDIVREYMELRFSIRALEMTTDEIALAMRQAPVNSEARNKVLTTLTLADLVKFAKEQPLPMENDTSLNHCIDFVRETRPPKMNVPEPSEVPVINQQKPERDV
jgi:hypothetical protein